MCVVFIFFFKQKTAYEMRISDWSSDVCSSDLYGFNKSHAAAYSLVAYQTAWLKCHYPAEFFSAVLTYEIDKHERMALIKDDMEEMGISQIGRASCRERVCQYV